MGQIPDFDDWYRDTYQVVYAAALFASGNDRACADDATSEAFIEAFRRWRTVSVSDSPRWWTVKVATNRVRRLQRGRTRRLQREAKYTVGQPFSVDPSDEQGNNPIWEEVEKLSPRQRQAIVLRYIEGLPQADAAERMGVTPGTAAATLNQARRNLRESLAD